MSKRFSRKPTWVDEDSEYNYRVIKEAHRERRRLKHMKRALHTGDVVDLQDIQDEAEYR